MPIKNQEMADVTNLIRKVDKTDLSAQCQFIRREITLGLLNNRYGIIEMENGMRLLTLIDKSEVCRFVSDDKLIGDVLSYMEGTPECDPLPKNAKVVAEAFRLTADPMETPKTVRFLGDSGTCFHRLPFDPDPYGGDVPIFTELLERTSNKEALMHWIGSLFVEDSNRQQYVWLYGEGNNGKGALMRFLQKCFGPAFLSTEPPERDDKFWNINLLDKRLVAFPDCNNHRFPVSQKFKMISGDDPIFMRPLFKQGFSATISCKFIFGSNDKPSISSQCSDTRRVIYCEMGPIVNEIDPEYEQKLWTEAPVVIGTCIEEYKRTYKDHRPIKTDENVLGAVIDESEAELEAVFRENFLLYSGNDDVEKTEFYFTTNELGKLVNKIGLRKNRFLKYIRARYKIENKPVKTGKKRSYGNDVTERRYFGAKMITVFCEKQDIKNSESKNHYE